MPGVCRSCCGPGCAGGLVSRRCRRAQRRCRRCRRAASAACAARSTCTRGDRTAPAPPSEVAAAAARAGLQFVILTDHGDGTREPEPPAYRGGVLCIDAVEISTDGGHVVALGLPKSPYPLGGEARDVIEDIARLGGLSIAAHPGSVEAGTAVDATGRAVRRARMAERRQRVARRVGPGRSRARCLTYPARTPEALATLLDRPDDLMRAVGRAHARRRRRGRGRLPTRTRASGCAISASPMTTAARCQFLSYEAMLPRFSIALPGVVLTGDAPADAEAIARRDPAGTRVFDDRCAGGPAAMSLRDERTGRRSLASACARRSGRRCASTCGAS